MVWSFPCPACALSTSLERWMEVMPELTQSSTGTWCAPCYGEVFPRKHWHTLFENHVRKGQSRRRSQGIRPESHIGLAFPQILRKDGVSSESAPGGM